MVDETDGMVEGKAELGIEAKDEDEDDVEETTGMGLTRLCLKFEDLEMAEREEVVFGEDLIFSRLMAAVVVPGLVDTFSLGDTVPTANAVAAAAAEAITTFGDEGLVGSDDIWLGI